MKKVMLFLLLTMASCGYSKFGDPVIVKIVADHDHCVYTVEYQVRNHFAGSNTTYQMDFRDDCNRAFVGDTVKLTRIKKQITTDNL